MARFEKAVLGVIAGILLSVLGVAILRAVAGGALATFLNANAFKTVGLDKNAATNLPLMFFVYLPALYAAGTYGPAARVLAGTGLTFLAAPLAEHAYGYLHGFDDATFIAMGLGLTLLSCLSSWRRYVAAEVLGLLMAVRVAVFESGDAHVGVVLVLGLLFLGPVLALGGGVLHVVESRIAPDNVVEPQAQAGKIGTAA